MLKTLLFGKIEESTSTQLARLELFSSRKEKAPLSINVAPLGSHSPKKKNGGKSERSPYGHDVTITTSSTLQRGNKDKSELKTNEDELAANQEEESTA